KLLECPLRIAPAKEGIPGSQESRYGQAADHDDSRDASKRWRNGLDDPEGAGRGGDGGDGREVGEADAIGMSRLPPIEGGRAGRPGMPKEQRREILARAAHGAKKGNRHGYSHQPSEPRLAQVL